jgi:ADP-heptose:LPS heptosyltransferase
MGRILVIRGGAIGDFVLTVPVLSALRSQFPRASVEILGYPAIARIARIGNLVSELHAIEARPLAGFFARHGELDDAMASFFQRFDVILSYLYDPDGIFRENVGRCSRAQFHGGPHRPDERGRTHAIETFLEPLRNLAIFEADPVPRLDPSPTSPGPGAWVAVHPGSGSESKNWPERRWLELLHRTLQHTPCNILLVGGEAEGDRLDRLAQGLPAPRLRILRSRPLEEVASLLRGCSHFIGHDSGITHLAAAVGLPCLVLWGPSNPALWRPRGDRILVIQDDCGLAGLACDTVWEVLSRQLPGTPPTQPPPSDGSAPPQTAVG